MSFLRSNKNKDETPSDVRRSYDNRAKQFLKQVKADRGGNDPIGSVFDWGHAILHERQDMNRRIGAIDTERQDWFEKREKLKKHLESARSQLFQERNASQDMEAKHHSDVERMREDHARHVSDSRRDYDQSLENAQQDEQARLAELRMQHMNEIQHRDAAIRNLEAHLNKELATRQRDILALKARYEEDFSKHQKVLANVRDEHHNDMAAKQTQHEFELRDHEEEFQTAKTTHTTELAKQKADHTVKVEELMGQLLVNQQNNTWWPDEKLRLSFKELQGLINSLTTNTEFRVPKGQQLSSTLDATNFVARVGRGKSYVLLRSIIWSIIHERLFSAPLGFGAFGPDEAHGPLMNAYLAWRKLLGSNADSDNGFSIFTDSATANTWRSVTFRSIHEALNSPEGQTSALAKSDKDNVNKTTADITELLSEVASLSERSISDATREEVRQVVVLGREIALQFGIHTAKLCLLVPDRGEQVRIGAEYHDCQDGDLKKGTSYTVDLVPAPGLQKEGDGRSDMDTSAAKIAATALPTTDGAKAG